MIGLVHGPPGLLRRVLGEVVPAGVGVLAGAFLSSFAGLAAGLLLGLLAWGLTSLLLVHLRRRPGLRRLYRVLVLLHVAFWSAQGLRQARLEPPGSVATEAGARGALGRFRVGTATEAFRLPRGTTLAGWGMAPRRRALPAFAGMGLVGDLARRWMGPPAPGEPARFPLFEEPREQGEALGARALVLRPEGGGGPGLLLVRLDLVVVGPRLREAVAARVADLGLSPVSLLVIATHTHSAPGGAVTLPLAEVLGCDHADVRVFEAVADAAAAALRGAWASARSARLVVAEARDRDGDGRLLLARTRGEQADRDPAADDRKIDDRVLALRFEGLADGQPIAVLLSYAVQPVMLRPAHRALGRDLAGALEDALQDTLPGRPPVLFVNGCCADVTPRREGASGTGAAVALARSFAAAVAPALAREGTRHDRITVTAARAWRDLGTPHALVAWGDRGALARQARDGPFAGGTASALLALALLPANAALWSLGLPEARTLGGLGAGLGAVVRLDGMVPAGPHGLGAVTLSGADGSVVATLLSHPFVATQAVGRTWRERARGLGLPPPLLAGLEGGAAGYLVTREEYRLPTYEALSSLYGPDAALAVEEALFAALARTLPEPPSAPASGSRGGGGGAGGQGAPSGG